MPKAIRDMQEVPLNPFEALKRAYISRGYLPKYFRAAVPAPSPDNPVKKSTKNSGSGSSGAKAEKDEPDLESQVSEEGDSKGPEKELSKRADPKMATSEKDLSEVTDKSLEVLYKATTVFPLALFPDTITLDREKLTIAKRSFFRTATITSAPVSEILSVEATVGMFFGSLHFVMRFFADNEKRLDFLWRQDAEKLQQMIHGFIIAHRKEINTEDIPTEELIQLLTELGTGQTD